MYKTVLEIVNIVLKRLHINTVASLDSSDFSELILDSLNNVVSDITEAGNFVDRRKTGEFTLDTAGTVLVSASSPIHNIEDVYYGTLELVPKQPHEIRNRRRQAANTTRPLEFSVVDASAGTIELAVWGIPTEATVVDVAYYIEPPQYTSESDSEVIPYDWLTVAQGTYADMVLREAGETSSEYQMEYAKYKQRRDKAVSKFTTDTGTELRISYKWR
jgi:hypothetical protein